MITNDLSDAQAVADAGGCGDGSPAVNEPVDDLLILASVQPIDGPGSVLAQAGPCLIRDENVNGQIDIGDFPGMGVMFFDEADLDNGALGVTVLHEMGHVLGYGVLWDVQGLLADPASPSTTGADPHFTGARSHRGVQCCRGNPVQRRRKSAGRRHRRGPGTINMHWRESVFDNELMTGFVELGASPGPQPLSAITIASFASQGYTVNPSAADPYTLPLGAARATGRRGRIELVDDIARMPIRLIAPNGRVTRTIRP